VALKYGDSLYCGVEDFNTTQSGTATKTWSGPRCVLSEKQNGGDLVARVEWVSTCIGTTTFNIAMGRLRVPTITDTNQNALYGVNVAVNAYVKDSNGFYRLRPRTF